MAVTIQLPPDLESRVRARAGDIGLPPEEVAMQILREGIEPSPPNASYVREERLLQEIVPPFTAEFYRRYLELREKLREEAISEADRAELISLNTRLEDWNVARLTAVLELSRLRRVSFDEMMRELKIGPIPELCDEDD